MREVPATILVGEIVDFGFRARAPLVGRRSETLALYVGNQPKPVTLLRPTIIVASDAPRVIWAPPSVHFQLVRGEAPARRDVLISTIELAGSTAFVERLRCEPTDLASLKLVEIREDAAYDPNYVRRHYHFRLSPNVESASHAAIAGTVCIETGNRANTGLHQIPLQIKLLEPVVLVPSKLQLPVQADGSTPTRVVEVVWRGSSRSPVRLHEFDSHLVEVKPAVGMGSGNEAFEVRARAVPVKTRATCIIFAIQAAEKRFVELPVHFEFSGHAPTESHVQSP